MYRAYDRQEHVLPADENSRNDWLKNHKRYDFGDV